MQVFRKIEPNLILNSSLALGMFDGVHVAHKAVILDAVNKAKILDAVPAVVAFANHPQCVTSKTPTKLLTTLDDRLDLFAKLGIKAALILDFTSELSDISADDYLQTVLLGALNAKSISIGYDHCFGKGREGNYDFLQENSSKYNYEVDVIPPVSIEGQIVSSSVIRSFIALGNMESAANLLERPYSLKGNVIKGKQRGRTLGFPTANLDVDKSLMIPSTGIYAGVVEFENQQFKAVINIGKNPTFGDIHHISIEVYILNFSKNIYNQSIKVDFIKKIRDEIKFASVESLVAQIKIDCDDAVKVLN